MEWTKSLKKTGKSVIQKLRRKGASQDREARRETKAGIPPEAKKKKPAPGDLPQRIRLVCPRIRHLSHRRHGASAGGLEAFTSFSTTCLRTATWLSSWWSSRPPGPHHMMPELLKRHTPMDVIEAQDGIARGARPRLCDARRTGTCPFSAGWLQISAPAEMRGLRIPHRLVLPLPGRGAGRKGHKHYPSGTGSTGRSDEGDSRRGRMCMVQDPETARYDGMPGARSSRSCGLRRSGGEDAEQLQGLREAVLPQEPGTILYLGDSSLTAIQNPRHLRTRRAMIFPTTKRRRSCAGSSGA